MRAFPVLALLAFGCGPTTGIDVTIVGADQLGADQIIITPMTANISGRTAVKAPQPARALAATEDVRIVLADDLDGMDVAVSVKLFKAGRLIQGSEQMTAGHVGVGLTKRVRVCYDKNGIASCPSAP